MHRTQGIGAAAQQPLVGPVTSFVVGSCALAATGAMLGADWLKVQSLGTPAGVWVILGGIGLIQSRTYFKARRAAEPSTPSSAVAPRPSDRRRPFASSESVASPSRASCEPPLAGAAGLVPADPVTSALLTAAGSIADGFLAVSRFGSVSRAGTDRLEETLSEWHDRHAWPTRPLRIGLDVTREVSESLTAAPGALPVEWVEIDPGLDDQADCRARSLDALVRQPAYGPLRVAAAEREGRDAAWYDWSVPPPMSYASVFPFRVDSAGFACQDKDWIEHNEAPLLRLLIETGALLSRSPMRLSFSDRLRGRRPVTSSAQPDSKPAPLNGAVEACMFRLSRLLDASRRESRTSAAMRAAARVTSAWFSTSAGYFDLDTRTAAIETAAKVLDEPESTLRLAAARFAAGDDDAGLAALLTGHRSIRERGIEPICDHLAFLQSEIENGTADPLTLGRVAAGMGLAYAAAPVDRVEYLKEDLMDDLRYAGWLLGRDNDRALLVRVLQTLERERLGSTVVAKAA
jgi:hypothetical protein